MRAWGSLDPTTAARRSVTQSQLASRELIEGDLLLEKSGGGITTPIGRVGLVPALKSRSICSNFMQLMRPDPSRVEPRFLHLYLNALQATGATEHLQKASTNLRNIKASEYANIEVSIPSLEHQRQVVGAVDSLWAKLSSTVPTVRTAKARSHSLRRALLAAAFSGRLTGRTSDMDRAEEFVG
nr:restriction endonuclease subunit S [Cellulomonas septica]